MRQGKGYFVTGTDTGCGKTEMSLALMHLLRKGGRSVLGMKPVASGADWTPEGLRNADALRLQAQGSVRLSYDEINPYAFAPPVAPHIAAVQAGVEISLDFLAKKYAWLAGRGDSVIVEGVGGWKVPLGPEQDMAQLAVRLGLPVILVVGLRLGCLNHALLTAESIQASGATLVAWIGNTLDPEMLDQEANITTLAARLACPCLGILPWFAKVRPHVMAGYLRLPEAGQ